MIKLDPNRGRLEKNNKWGANKLGCKRMLNEAVLKCAAVSQRNAGREGGRERENEEMAFNARLPVWMGTDPRG